MPSDTWLTDVDTAAALTLGAAVAVEHAAVHALEKLDSSKTAQEARRQGPPARAMAAWFVGAH